MFYYALNYGIPTHTTRSVMIYPSMFVTENETVIGYALFE